ncbi:MAG: TonB-dependent receptor [Steroidobacteraceae bacterium]|nr:TonB-dependent receptor [Steroidobacteraceae bacterium]
MEHLPASFGGLAAVAFLLGLKHGFDADHLATIDGLTRVNTRAGSVFARWCGALFSLGHGAVVIAIALLVSSAVARWQTPGWLETTGVVISIFFLTLLGVLNLYAVWRAAPDEVVTPIGIKGRFLGALGRARNPFVVALVGALFALSFDTISQAAFFALAAGQYGGPVYAASLGALFVLGMLVTDGANGLWISRLILRADETARIASRVMSLAVACVSLLVAGFSTAKLLLPRVDGWAEGKELLFGATVVVVVLVGFVWGRSIAAARAARTPRGGSAVAAVAAVALTALIGVDARAGGITGADLEEVTVRANRLPLTGLPRAASEGTVLGEQLEYRPLLRVGELLETVPGLVVTQHTGDGKANQYFLRGFNLDHGTDFATRVEGMPVNMPTHGHGQGYMDVNFVIPELVERIVYRKGTYYADLGNFSAVGAAELQYVDAVRPFIAVSGGEDNYVRALAAGSMPLAGGSLLAGFEYDHTDGPWVLPEDLTKVNGVLRWSRRGETSGIAVDLMAYDGEWTSTDQIPRRAVESGALDRYGYIDPTAGGESHRYSLSAAGYRGYGPGRLDFNAYAIDYRLQLYSNFTYALDPDHGDQFEQFDDRRVHGAALAWSQPFAFGAGGSVWRIGADIRVDDISPVGLYLTTARARHATIREDRVEQTLAGAWTAVATQWTPWLRSELGLRADRLGYDVASDRAVNSGSGHDTLASPKGSLALGPWRDTEFFVAAGRGFHSNDVRGATIRVDPVDGVTPVDRVTPLARADGSEIGLRTALVPRTQLSVALWKLDLDSELLFIGDGGTTEATRPSRREGVELSVYSRPRDWLIVDADYAASKARFRDLDPAGDRIPGAVERVASLGITLQTPAGWFGGARLRYLGPAALLEDDSVRAPSSTLVNLEAGRRLGDHWRVSLQLFNAFDRKVNDITYYYESQLPGEAAPVEDLHFHPAEPRTLRGTVHYSF